MEKIKNDNLSPDRDALLSNTDLVIEVWRFTEFVTMTTGWWQSTFALPHHF